MIAMRFAKWVFVTDFSHVFSIHAWAEVHVRFLRFHTASGKSSQVMKNTTSVGFCVGPHALAADDCVIADNCRHTPGVQQLVS